MSEELKNNVFIKELETEISKYKAEQERLQVSLQQIFGVIYGLEMTIKKLKEKEVEKVEEAAVELAA